MSGHHHNATGNPGNGDAGAEPSAWLFRARTALVASLLAGTLLLVGWLLGQFGLRTPGRTLQWVSLGIGLIYGLKAAWDTILERRIDIDVLMAVGAILAAAMGSPAEGALLLTLFVLSGSLEELAMARTTRAVEELHKLIPTAALKWHEASGTESNGDGEWRPADPQQLIAGDRVKILPGELIPADARITRGSTIVNQATLTGESLPREVEPEAEIFAGTLNAGNPIEAVVLRPAAQSGLQRVLDLVLEAQQAREPIQQFIDRLSQPYAIGVFAISALVLLIWWLILGQPLVGTEGDGAVFTAITLLIVLSPCALIIATPTATLAAISRGARGGVLFKGGQAIERLARLSVVALDKTGTLTEGNPTLIRVHPIAWTEPDRLVSIAAGLEADSTHPIADAIRKAAERQGIAPAPIESPEFAAGRGLAGQYDGHEARMGNLAFIQPLLLECLRHRVADVLDSAQRRGEIATAIVWRDQAGVLVLADRLRAGADRLVSDLHALGVKPVVMLSGDNKATVAAVASAVGIDQWSAELLPEGKVAALHVLKAEAKGGGVGVIGDGVNDAPALAAADVSIAIGSIGSDAALESADIVLMRDDLTAVPWAIRLARRARATIRINLGFALTAIVVMAILTLVQSALGRPFPLWAGVVGHEGGTLLVVLHSLLLLSVSSEKQTAKHSPILAVNNHGREQPEICPA